MSYENAEKKAAEKRAEANRMRLLRERAERAGSPPDVVETLSAEESRLARKADRAEAHAEHFDEIEAANMVASATRQADAIRLVRDRVRISGLASLDRAVRVADEHRGRGMDTENWKLFTGSARSAVNMDELDAKLETVEQRHRDRADRYQVVREERQYGPESPFSYFADRAILAEPSLHMFHPDASRRFQRHAIECAGEMRVGSPEGRYLEAALREQTRMDDEVEHRKRARDLIGRAREYNEVRAITSGGGITAAAASSASVFVSPWFARALWSPFRSAHRTFADCCDSEPLPQFGMELYVPQITSTAAAAVQTEGSGVTETDPSFGLGNSSIQTVAGQFTVSLQFRDRGYIGNGSTDVQLAKQLQQQLDASIDVYVINAAISSAGVVTDSTTFTVPLFYQDQAKAREILTDTAGTRLRPTSVFSTSDMYNFVTRQTDATTNRPIVVPTFAPGYPIVAGADDGAQGNGKTPPWSRFTGTVLPGGTLWYTDDNIPASGSNTQILVSAPDEAVVVFESDAPVLTAFTDAATTAASLEVILNLRSYVSALVRHASGTAVITGNTYPTSNV